MARVSRQDSPRKLLSNQVEVMIAATGIPDGVVGCVWGCGVESGTLAAVARMASLLWSVVIGSATKESAHVSMGPPGESGS